MKYTIIIATCLALVQAAPLLSYANHGKLIPNSYIVILKDGYTSATFKSKFDDIAMRQHGLSDGQIRIHREYKAIP
ncbi:hypothetical protein BGZ46_002942, partial [Entomortierella lignicola]